MKVGFFKRLSREDLGGASDLPDWIEPLFTALNQQLEPLSIALNNKLSFADNFFSYVTTQTFTHGTELAINPQNTSAKVIGMIPIYSADANYLIHSYGCEVLQNGSVGVTLYFAKKTDGSLAVAGTQVKTTILILFG